MTEPGCKDEQKQKRAARAAHTTDFSSLKEAGRKETEVVIGMCAADTVDRTVLLTWVQSTEGNERPRIHHNCLLWLNTINSASLLI